MSVKTLLSLEPAKDTSHSYDGFTLPILSFPVPKKDPGCEWPTGVSTV